MPNVFLQRGFSLIEVLVAVLVVSIGLLGVAGMQLVGLKGNQQSFSKNQAAHHVQSVLEKMRGNPAGVFAGNYVFNSANINCNTVPAKNCSDSSAVCSSAEIATYDLFKSFCGSSGGAVGGIKGDLSGAELLITCPSACASGVSVTVSLGWDEQLLGKEGDNSGETSISRQLSINTEIGQ